MIDLKNLRKELILLDFKDDKVMELVSVYSACLKNLKSKKVLNTDSGKAIDSFLMKKDKKSFVMLRSSLTGLITLLSQQIEDANAKGSL